MAALTLIEVKSYLRVDASDDDALLTALMSAADLHLKASIGATYDNTNEMAKTLAKLVISDLYENRETTEKASANVRRLVDDFALQLRLGLRA